MTKNTDPVGVTRGIVSFVRVVLSAVNSTIFDDELEGVVHETTIASFIQKSQRAAPSMFYVSVTLFEIPKRSIKTLVRNPSSPVISRSRHWLLGLLHGRRAAPLQALHLSASRSHLRRRAVPRLLSASRVFFLLWLCPGPAASSCLELSKRTDQSARCEQRRHIDCWQRLAGEYLLVGGLDRRNKAVTCITYGISGNYLNSGSEGGMVRVWDARTHNIVHVVPSAQGSRFKQGLGERGCSQVSNPRLTAHGRRHLPSHQVRPLFSLVNNILVIRQHFSEKYTRSCIKVATCVVFLVLTSTEDLEQRTHTRTINVPMPRRSSLCPNAKEKTILVKFVMHQPSTGSNNACSFLSLPIALPLKRMCQPCVR
ncbi:hypothetical protein DVH24_020696 [Malus domestica]|uniref:Uncharacterized protein n=1 Tax=Malus domestica TaxID=3750 RepID=A0A498JCX8_MALDO|nr:hypothetical protein DVH24_020696 [Malus domestica]